MNLELSRVFAETSYLTAAILFVLGLKALSHPQSARRGMFLAEIGMLLAVVGTCSTSRSSPGRGYSSVSRWARPSAR